MSCRRSCSDSTLFDMTMLLLALRLCQNNRIKFSILICAATLALTCISFSYASEHKLISEGRNIYRNGILPSGQSLDGYIKGDLHAPGHAFACESCHMRSGLGSLEGNVLTTPVSGSILYAPREVTRGPRPGMTMGSKGVPPPQPPPPRPAYTDVTLANVMRGGVDPAGRLLDPIMPRYNFNDHEMAALVAYLKTLSVGYSPGVDTSTLHFATVISDDVPPDLYRSHLALLDDFIKKTNEQYEAADMTKNSRTRRQLAVNGRVGQRKLVLSRWFLKGKPDTWRDQLLEYNRRTPAFALLGGMSLTSWRPVHEFCEENRIPVLFPITDDPVISDHDWYTLYLSKGYFQEGEAAARFLAGNTALVNNRLVILHRRGYAGDALLNGFISAWNNLGKSAPQLIPLAAGEKLSPEKWSKLVDGNQPVTVVVWDGAEGLPLLGELSSLPVSPSVVASSRYLGKGFTQIPAAARKYIYFTYPERLPNEERMREEFFFGKSATVSAIDRITKQTYPLVKVMAQLLVDMKNNYYREYFLDLAAMTRDMEVPLYERLSFGPGQRYASKGCYIVQLGEGEQPPLIKQSDWVLY